MSNDMSTELVQATYIDPWAPTPYPPWGVPWLAQTPPPTVITTTATSAQPVQSDLEQRLIKTVLLLIDLLTEIEFDGVRPHNSDEWETQQEFRDDLIDRTFVDKSELSLE